LALALALVLVLVLAFVRRRLPEAYPWVGITPLRHYAFVDPLSPPEFAEMVRQLNRAATAAGLQSPSFVSPPREPTAVRTIRWLTRERALVAVRRGDRAADVVVGDMIAGVVAANHLSGSEAEDAARKLAECLTR